MITASPGKGKSHTMTRATRSLIVSPGTIRSANPGSDIGLQHILALEPDEGAPKGTPLPCNYCLLHADELKGLIGRLSIQNSGLGTMLTDMWDNDIYETATAKGKITTNARFSLLGGVSCRDQDDFAALFGEGTMGGLYDRMIVVPQAEAWEWDGNWEPTLVQRHPWPVTIPASAITAIDEWMRTTKKEVLARDPDSSAHELVGRIAANARRVALISASANNESIMSEACVQAALRFANWQLKVKTKFSASGAANDDATARIILIKAFEKLAAHDVTKFKEFGSEMYHTYGDLYRSSNLRRYEAKLGPGIFNRCWQAMVSLEILEREPICGEDGEPKPNLYTKRCRIAN